jgi:hypothetical protein
MKTFYLLWKKGNVLLKTEVGTFNRDFFVENRSIIERLSRSKMVFETTHSVYLLGAK